MALTPDHLIERAAALLKANSVPHPTVAPRIVDDRASTPSFSALPDAPETAGRLDDGPPMASDDQLADWAGTASPILPMPPAYVPQTSGVADTTALGRSAPPAPGTAVPSPRPSASAPSVRPDATSLLPVISLDALERGGMVVARAARTRISEEYRIVIGRVMRALRDEPDGDGAHNALMVTSARPGEGKTFTALNLAGSIAQHSTEKVLLVDVDAKLRPLSTLIGVGERLGFHDLVVDPTLRPEDVILNTAIGNLSFLPVGTRSGEVSDTASVRPITPTITRLARRYPKHLILIDAPPCLSTSDPHTIAPFVGQVVMVIEAERTQRSEVEAALELVRVCPTITMLLNKVKLTTSHTFGAYDYYGSYT
ncbi:MAG: hypothetical protein H7Z10_06590 [Gemmatimonadaceae bacterium]|nr:hypothetical protein [Acetobacteraceae bacterium]